MINIERRREKICNDINDTKKHSFFFNPKGKWRILVAASPDITLYCKQSVQLYYKNGGHRYWCNLSTASKLFSGYCIEQRMTTGALHLKWNTVFRFQIFTH